MLSPGRLENAPVLESVGEWEAMDEMCITKTEHLQVIRNVEEGLKAN